MSRLKKTFISNVGHLISEKGFRRSIRRTGLSSISLLYHAVSDNELPHIHHLYKIKSKKEFIADLDLLLRSFKPVSLQEYIKSVRDNYSAEPIIHLTFDDGLKEFYDVVAPILLEKGVPATCFLNNNFLDNKELFYRYKVSLLINKILEIEKSNNLLKNEIKVWQLSNNFMALNVREVLLSLKYKDATQIDDLAQRIRVDFPEFLKINQPYLTTEQVNSLIKSGFTFGGHSLDHPEYYLLDEEEQLRQTTESVQGIATHFNLDYKVFSFPFTDDGVNLSFFKKLQQKMPDVVTFGCAGLKMDSSAVNYQRIPVEDFNADALSILKGEFSYFRILKIFGRDVIKRS